MVPLLARTVVDMLSVRARTQLQKLSLGIREMVVIIRGTMTRPNAVRGIIPIRETIRIKIAAPVKAVEAAAMAM